MFPFHPTPLVFAIVLLIADISAGILVAQTVGHENDFRSPPVSESSSATGSLSPDEKMLQLLRERVLKKPDDSETWRLIGRLERKRDNLSAAVDAAGQAVALDGLNAAAHFDFAELLLLAELPELAREHFEKVLAIAPNSSYATQVLESGFQLDTNTVSRISTEISHDWSSEYKVSPSDGSQILQDGKIQQTGYEIQTFDGDDEVQQRLRQQEHEISDPKPLRLSLESGALFNTNISLTPISRELAQSSAASAQLFAAPDAEWTIKRFEDSRYGLQGKGFFTVNENQWSAFNLASFQPGAFFEKKLEHADNKYIGRIDYSYALDIVAGDRIGDRHTLMGSVIQIRPDFNVLYGYFSIGFSEFDNDGADPANTSLDGTNLTTGVSRFIRTDFEKMPLWIIGIDLEHAAAEGANFRYTGLTFHTSTKIQMTERLSFHPDAGVGGRNYPDFTGPVDRDEVTWRVGAKLKWKYNEHLTFGIVANHNRFASDNVAFDAERSQIGLISTMTY